METLARTFSQQKNPDFSRIKEGESGEMGLRWNRLIERTDEILRLMIGQ